MFPPSLLILSSREGGLLDLPLRASNDEYPMVPPSLLAFPLWNGTRGGPTAAVERAHSDRARSGSTGPPRVSFHSYTHSDAYSFPASFSANHR